MRNQNQNNYFLFYSRNYFSKNFIFQNLKFTKIYFFSLILSLKIYFNENLFKFPSNSMRIINEIGKYFSYIFSKVKK